MRILSFFAFLLFFVSSFGQLIIDDSQNLTTIVSDLEMDGMIISNITVDMPYSGSGNNYPAGTYNDQIGWLGLDQGILFTTGAAKNAIGPNDSHNKSQTNNSGNSNIPTSPELNDLLGEISDFEGQYELSAETINDYVIIEFDFVTVHDNIVYNYVFGSEEYPFPNAISKSDGFGFYLSGPGVSNLTNIARAGSAPISARSVNHTTNDAYYVANGVGDSPFIDFYHQYDGSTTVLQAKHDVVPCQTYHVKMILFDADWTECDSGVFMEPGEAEDSKGPTLEVVYESDDFDYAIEGCHEGHFVLTRSEYDLDNLDQAVSYDLLISGSASSGADYDAIASTIVIPANSESVIIPVNVIDDLDDEDREEILIKVVATCVPGAVLTEATMYIEDDYVYDVPDASLCLGDSVKLNAQADSTEIGVTWPTVDFLSCTSCLTPFADPLKDTTLEITVTHLESGCTHQDTVSLEVINTVADFTYFTKDNYTTLDAFFENTSSNSDAWFWTFGDGEDSDDKNPVHIYDIINYEEPESFSIRLIAEYTLLGCRDTADTIITIGEPLFIPNIFTPNQDESNETFIVEGIQPGIWILDVFNRWGDQVYQSGGYSNDWDGHDVADGVYYIELRNPPGDRSFKEWVLITR